MEKLSDGVTEINFDVINEAWRSVQTRSLPEFDSDDIDDKSLNELISLLEKFNELSKDDDPMALLNSSNFSESNKQHILRLWRTKPDEDIKWGIDVVVGNSNIRKSLHPKIWLSLDGREIEMNLEAFAKLRYEVSRILSRIDCYT